MRQTDNSAKLADMVIDDALHQQDLKDPQYRAAWARTSIAAAIAVEVVRYRANNNLSQTAMAKHLSMSQPQLARIERGDHTPTIHTLARLADLMDVAFNITVGPSDEQGFPSYSLRIS